MKPIKVAIAVPLFKRPQIFDIFCASICKNAIAMKGAIEFQFYFALDNKDDQGKNYEIYLQYLTRLGYSMLWEIPNRPLSNKWNQLVENIKGYDWEYLFVTGSDGIFSNSFWLKYWQLAKKNYDYIGIKDYFLIDSKTLQMQHWNGFTKDRKGEVIGAGRMLRRDLVEDVNYRLWGDGLNEGLDKSMTSRIKAIDPYKMWCKDEAICMMDIKSDVNIHSFQSWKGINIDYRQVLPAYFDREIINKILPLHGGFQQKI